MFASPPTALAPTSRIARRTQLALALFLLASRGEVAFGASAQSVGTSALADCEAPLIGAALPTAAELERLGAVVGTVTVVGQDIFDPKVKGEDFWAFRLANRLHVQTQPEVIRHRLLFAPGELFAARRLAESERVLRLERYFYSVEIAPVAYCNGRVDVEVRTRDVWSLKAGVTFNRKGGANSWSTEVQDSNFLGLGKDIEVSYIDSIDRESVLARFRDRDFLARRLRLEALYADSTDGEVASFTLARPFWSLDSRRQWGVRLSHDRRIDKRYAFGTVLDRFLVEQEVAELSFGFSPGLVNGTARRLRFGLTFDDRSFSVPGKDRLARPLPTDRRFVYPWIAVDAIEEGYIVAHNLDRIDRAEDLNLGRRLSGWLGYSAPGLGADRGTVLFGGAASNGHEPERLGGLFFWSSWFSGRHEGSEFRHLLAGLEARFYHRTFGNHLFFALARYDLLWRPDNEAQLLLGGDNGLRGYPLRYEEGNRRFLVTLEQRFYWQRELFHLVRTGAAIFADVGRAFWVGYPDRRGQPTLRDVGLGLRFSSSRSANSAMVHFDVAFPLDGPSDLRQVQWLVTTSDTF